ncbi:MAG TPA: hypothetical protein VG900_01160 [Hyphomicrobiaceae bacterium]|nr:hypothetical protein [Hyphomicrobiaceae bacterium]
MLAASGGAGATDVSSILANTPAVEEVTQGSSSTAFRTFLDRLMRAESNGRDDAANPRSTAVGPYQFIKTTFIDVLRRHFSADVAAMSDEEILDLRTNRYFARRAAEVFSRDNADFLSDQGLNPTFGHLRLAFLLGPTAAARVLQATPETPLADILGPTVVKANPFMAGMSAFDLILRTARDISNESELSALPAPAPHVRPVEARPSPRAAPRPKAVVQARPKGKKAAPAPQTTASGLVIKCNQKLVACRRWITLHSKSRTRGAANPQAPGA